MSLTFNAEWDITVPASESGCHVSEVFLLAFVDVHREKFRGRR